MKNVLLFSVSFLFCIGLLATGCSRKAAYTTAADTVNLNKEYRSVMSDINKLKSDLNKTQSNIPVYEARAQKAEAKSKIALEESSQQASRATSGSLKQAKKAEKKADKAKDAAEDARDARNKANSLRKRANELNADLAKKQQRLQELEESRSAIYSRANSKSALDSTQRDTTRAIKTF